MMNFLNDFCCCKNIDGFTLEAWTDSFNLHNTEDDSIISYLCSLMCLLEIISIEKFTKR